MPRPAPRPQVLFRDAGLFDGHRWSPRTSVLIGDGRILEVGPDLVAPAGAEVVDGRGRAVVPGLVDAHFHLLGTDPLRQATRFGTTTVLSMGDDPYDVAAARTAVAEDTAPYSADLRSAGVAARAPGGRAGSSRVVMPTVAGPHEAEAFVAARVAEGADYVKIRYEDGDLLSAVAGQRLPVVSRETLVALVEHAHRAGLQAVAHIGTLAAAYDAIEAGIDGLAHVFVDVPPDDRIAGLAAERGIFVVATVNAFELIARRADDTVGGHAAIVADPRVRPYLRAEDLALVEHLDEGSVEVDLDAARSAVAAFVAAGVPVLAGSDPCAFLHGVALWRELELLAECGLGPLGALAAATSRPAERFGLSDRGVIEPGRQADLLLVEGDPSVDIGAIRDLSQVWCRGRLARRDEARPIVVVAEPPLVEPPAVEPAAVSFSGGGALTQTDWGTARDFVLATVDGDGVTLWRRDNGAFGYPWRIEDQLRRSVDGISVLAEGAELAVVLRQGARLDGVSWVDGRWSTPTALFAGATGDAALLPGGGCLVPTARGLQHLVHGAPHCQLDLAPTHAVTVGPIPGGFTALVWSDAGLVEADHRPDGWALVGPLPVTPAGAPALAGDEVIVPTADGLARLSRADDRTWTGRGLLPGGSGSTAVAAIVGSFGNLELVVRRGTEWVPYYRDARTDAWSALPAISDGQRVFGDLGVWEPVVRAGWFTRA